MVERRRELYKIKRKIVERRRELYKIKRKRKET